MSAYYINEGHRRPFSEKFCLKQVLDIIKCYKIGKKYAVHKISCLGACFLNSSNGTLRQKHLIHI